MGISFGRLGEKQRSHKIDKYLDQERRKQGACRRLLMIGDENSGKSTVLKQIQYICDKGFTNEQREYWKYSVVTYIINTAQQLCMDIKELNILDQDQKANVAPQQEVEVAIRAILGVSVAALQLDPELVYHIKRVFVCYLRNLDRFVPEHRFGYMENFYRFVNRLDIVCQPRYLPSDDDIILARHQDRQLVSLNLQYQKSKFFISEPSDTVEKGQMNKWIHCFEEVAAVVFVASLADYDHMTDYGSKLLLAREMLHSIVHNRFCGDKPFFVFLNKRDVFVEKIKISPLSRFIPGVDPAQEQNLDYCLQYLRSLFENVEQPAGVTIKVFHTCAIDTDCIKYAWERTHESILQIPRQ